MAVSLANVRPRNWGSGRVRKPEVAPSQRALDLAERTGVILRDRSFTGAKMPLRKRPGYKYAVTRGIKRPARPVIHRTRALPKVPKKLLNSHMYCDEFEDEELESSSASEDSDGYSDYEGSKPSKLILTKGLFAGKKGRKSARLPALPLPDHAAENLLTHRREFRLPYNIYCPTTRGKTVTNWKHLKRNHWLGDTQTYIVRQDRNGPMCICAPGNCSEDCLNRMVQIECDERNCPSGEGECGNRALQKMASTPIPPHMTPSSAGSSSSAKDRQVSPPGSQKGVLYARGYEVFQAGPKGFGLRAVRSYEPHELILEYTGEVITVEQMENRLGNEYRGLKNYYCLSLGNRLVIDSGKRGSEARFVNHSCAPNSRMEKWVVKGMPRIGLFVGDNRIAAGTEFTYDYNFDIFGGAIAQICYCGSDHCRGVIGKKTDLPSSRSPSGSPSPPSSQPPIKLRLSIPKTKAAVSATKPRSPPPEAKKIRYAMLESVAKGKAKPKAAPSKPASRAGFRKPVENQLSVDKEPPQGSILEELGGVPLISDKLPTMRRFTRSLGPVSTKIDFDRMDLVHKRNARSLLQALPPSSSERIRQKAPEKLDRTAKVAADAQAGASSKKIHWRVKRKLLEAAMEKDREEKTAAKFAAQDLANSKISATRKLQLKPGPMEIVQRGRWGHFTRKRPRSNVVYVPVISGEELDPEARFMNEIREAASVNLELSAAEARRARSGRHLGSEPANQGSNPYRKVPSYREDSENSSGSESDSSDWSQDPNGNQATNGRSGQPDREKEHADVASEPEILSSENVDAQVPDLVHVTSDSGESNSAHDFDMENTTVLSSGPHAGHGIGSATRSDVVVDPSYHLKSELLARLNLSQEGHRITIPRRRHRRKARPVASNAVVYAPKNPENQVVSQPLANESYVADVSEFGVSDRVSHMAGADTGFQKKKRKHSRMLVGIPFKDMKDSSDKFSERSARANKRREVEPVIGVRPELRTRMITPSKEPRPGVKGVPEQAAVSSPVSYSAERTASPAIIAVPPSQNLKFSTTIAPTATEIVTDPSTTAFAATNAPTLSPQLPESPLSRIPLPVMPLSNAERLTVRGAAPLTPPNVTTESVPSSEPVSEYGSPAESDIGSLVDVTASSPHIGVATADVVDLLESSCDEDVMEIVLKNPRLVQQKDHLAVAAQPQLATQSQTQPLPASAAVDLNVSRGREAPSSSRPAGSLAASTPPASRVNPMINLSNPGYVGSPASYSQSATAAAEAGVLMPQQMYPNLPPGTQYVLIPVPVNLAFAGAVPLMPYGQPTATASSGSAAQIQAAQSLLRAANQTLPTFIPGQPQSSTSTGQVSYSVLQQMRASGLAIGSSALSQGVSRQPRRAYPSNQ